MHPTDGELLLSVEEREGARVRSHLADCARCSARLDALLSELDQATRWITVLDQPVPVVSANEVVARARTASRTAVLPRLSARAASVAALLLIAGAAAAALPGSPVRRWLAQLRPEATPRAPAQLAPVANGFAGVALTADAPLEVILPATVTSGTIVLVPAEDELVRVRSSDPATGFSFGPGVLVLDTRSASLELEIASPPGLPRLTIRLGERTVLGRELPFATAALALGDTIRLSLGSR